MSESGIDTRLVRSLYKDKKNIMKYMRNGREGNDEEAILAAYDMQAGSYAAMLQDPEVRQLNWVNTGKLARLFDRLGCQSLLHCGTGEAITISHVVEQMKASPAYTYGFDISLSRLLHGQRYAQQVGRAEIRFFLASLMHVPIRDCSFDIVFTSHSMEPNGGHEREILEELYRVTRRYLVLREPSYELGNSQTRVHIEEHGFIRNLPGFIKELGYDVIEYGLFGDDENSHNQAVLTVIRKRVEGCDEGVPWQVTSGHPYASPISGEPLQFTGEAFYSNHDCLAFPVLGGIPCLLASHGIFSSKYLQFASPVEKCCLDRDQI